MKKIRLLLAGLLVAGLAFQGCEDMDDNAVPVNDFIWKGLNLYYLWQADVPNLADDRFANQEELNNFLEAYSSPESLFESLLYRNYPDGKKADRFSVIFSDYRVLENALQGVAKSNGVEFGLVYTDDTETDIFGYVRYILPNTDAATKDIQRGDIFYAVNGTELNVNNYQALLGQDTYTLNLATYVDGVITPTGEEVMLTKAEYAENPVYKITTHTVGDKKVGYLMYNGFYSTYDTDLNNAFGELAAAGVDELVLDLRYNSGGSVRTSTYLGSMITGPNESGKIFAKQQWNSKLQAYYEENNPGTLENRFGDELSNGTAINKLDLDRVFILTTESTASASELLINGLVPYMDVVVIGDTTTGKNVGSVTLYDSPDFTKNNRSGSHRYAMQPIVLKTVNADGFGDYTEGLAPTVELKEDYGNLGVLGELSEPLFAEAIDIIDGKSRRPSGRRFIEHNNFRDSKNMRRFGTEMYIEEMPEGSLTLLKQLQ